MAKKKSRKHGDHHARRATRPLHVVPQPPQGPEEQQLFQDLHRVLRAGEPLDLLMFVSSLMAATDPRRKDPFAGSAGDGVTLEDLVDSFVGVDHAETTAALHVVRAGGRRAARRPDRHGAHRPTPADAGAGCAASALLR